MPIAKCRMVACEKWVFIRQSSIGIRHFRGFRREPLPCVVQRLREDARLGEDGHEVVVAVPARDDVRMQVGDAATGDGEAEVEADVEGVGLEGGGEEAFAHDDLVEEVGALGGGEVLEVGHVAERDGEEVAGVVGKAVEDEVGERRAVDDDREAVVAEGRQLRERALHLGREARGLDVGHAPIGMELLHVRRKRGPRKTARGVNVKGRGRGLEVGRPALNPLPIGPLDLVADSEEE